MKQKLLVSLAALMVALSLTAVARGQEKPLTKDQVIILVRNQMGDEAGARAVQARGIDFVPTEDFLAALKKSGANDAFLQALRDTQKPKSAAGGSDEAKKSLSQKQILELLAGDVPSSRVAMLVGERGIDFKPTDDYLKTLQSAGAESDLLDALRVAKPPQVSLSSATRQTTPTNPSEDATQTEAQQHLMQGLQFRKQGQFPDAEQEYRAATSLDPKNANNWVALSSVYFQEGKLDDAVSTAHRALQLDPNLDRAHVALGVGIGSKGDYDGAAAEFRKALSLLIWSDTRN